MAIALPMALDGLQDGVVEDQFPAPVWEGYCRALFESIFCNRCGAPDGEKVQSLSGRLLGTARLHYLAALNFEMKTA